MVEYHKENTIFSFLDQITKYIYNVFLQILMKIISARMHGLKSLPILFSG